MSDLLFSRRLTWVIYEIYEDEGETYVIDVWSGDILSYMAVGYNAKSMYSNTMDDRLHIHFTDSDKVRHYYAELIESRYADRFIHK